MIRFQEKSAALLSQHLSACRSWLLLPSSSFIAIGERNAGHKKILHFFG
jgi:hypothetical protein